MGGAATVHGDAAPGALTLGRWTTDRAATDPSRPAIVDRGVTVSYGELEARATALAHALVEAGHGRGARIATVTGSTADQVVLLFACAKAGAMLVPLSWRLTARELAEQLRIADPSLLLVEDDHRPVAEAALDRLGDHGIRTTALGAAGAESLVPDAPAPAERAAGGAVQDDDGLLMLFTSGTTSAPKAVVLSHANCAWANLSLSRATPMTPDDVVLQVLPQHHVAGWNIQPLLAWWVGAQVVLERTFDAGRALALIERHRVTATMGVPTTFRSLIQHPDFAVRDLSSLRTAVVGGGMLDPRAVEQLARRGVPVQQGYGLTEAAPNVTIARDASDAGTVGRPYPHVDLALLVDGRVVHGAGTGELLVRGPAVFQGYFRDPEATAAATLGPWLRTGDLVERDPAGRIRIVDRVKDIVRSGGESIAPIEVELALLEHPAVADAAVAGVPSERWGEELVAWLVLAEPADERSLRDHLDGRLAGFKHPKRFLEVDQIPRTTSGKPLRRALIAAAQAERAEAR
ncbi:long-chain fatty acid--CoA ligase [Agrococcus sediminis]|uniref:Long-chain fatty acid--CoA ligase n=1 Tax=Agrococcus sediminis TaxID=2599924 RepID=A0A5M8QA75_9MICO|nr:AMP-binding protein [Agrococcus sediminis]KAA6432058.1 long-chain fatty acid--CoA ligase [Agrococcus sediminis]